jgi:hypothetical protein
MTTKNQISSARIPCEYLPLTQKTKNEFSEIDFDIDWNEHESSLFTINNDGYFCREIWKKVKNEFVPKQQIVLPLTRIIFLETEVEGLPYKIKLNLKDGKVMNVSKV